MKFVYANYTFKKDTKLLCKIAFSLNIMLSITVTVLLIRAIGSHLIDREIVMLIFLTPFLINVKQLNIMRKQ